MISNPEWWLDENRIIRAIRQDDLSRIREAEECLFQRLMGEHRACAPYERIFVSSSFIDSWTPSPRAFPGF